MLICYETISFLQHNLGITYAYHKATQN
jgi:hypothetical protein